MADEVTLGAVKHYIEAKNTGRVTKIDNKRITNITRILGAPDEKLAGIYLNKKLGAKVKRGDRLYTLYARSDERMRLALKAINKLHIFSIK